MDPVTHGLIGATATQSVAGKQNIRQAALIGVASAMIADLDVLISDPNNPLLTLEYHRQFSHSLIFIPIGALIAALLLRWFFRKHFSFKQIYGYCFLGYATSGIADSFTSYGTKLLWPFLDGRYSWNLISVFDPLFSLGILTTVFLASYKKESLYAWAGICWITLYLLAGFIQHERGEQVARNLASQRNHHVEQMVVKPTIANNLLWSIRYVSNGTLYAAGVHLSPFSGNTIYKGDSAPLLNWREQYASFQGTTLYEDIGRFEKLSSGYLISHPLHENVIGDGRYSMLPTKLHPLWGIKVDTLHPNTHLPFKTFRKTTPKIRNNFLNMLLGRKTE